MNKKNIVLILIITIFLSVMVMSVLGKVPDDKNRVDAESIVYYNQSGEVISDFVEDSINKYTVVTFDYKEGDTNIIEYNYSLELLPIETTDDSLEYSFLDGDSSTMEELFPNEEIPTKAEEEPKVEVQRFHFYKMTFVPEQRGLTSIRFKFNKGGVAKYSYLRFQFTEHHEEDVDDDF